MPPQLITTSCQARNTFPLMAGLTRYLGRRLNIPTRYEGDAPWQDRSRWLHAGEIHLGWICSKPYALQMDASPRPLEGLAVPIMRGELYAGRPVYYSYLVLHRDHPARRLEELAGARVGYNEPGSQSGYFSLVWALEKIGRSCSYFSEWIETGAHRNSIDLLAHYQIDAAAIDSTLWDFEISHDFEWLAYLKIIDQLGPFPAPPLAAHFSLPRELRQAIQQILFTMHEDPEGQAVLETSLMTHFEPVADDFYRQLKTP